MSKTINKAVKPVNNRLKQFNIMNKGGRPANNECKILSRK